MRIFVAIKRGGPLQESAGGSACLTIEETAQANASAAVGTAVGSQTKLDRELDSDPRP
jgi:hypothetical protein